MKAMAIFSQAYFMACPLPSATISSSGLQKIGNQEQPLNLPSLAVFQVKSEWDFEPPVYSLYLEMTRIFTNTSD